MSWHVWCHNFSERWQGSLNAYKHLPVSLHWLLCKFTSQSLLLYWIWDCSWQPVADFALLVGSWCVGHVLSGSSSHRTGPVHLLFPQSLGCRGASGVRRMSRPTFYHNFWQRQNTLSPLALLLSLLQMNILKGLFIWTSNLVCQNYDVIWVEDLKWLKLCACVCFPPKKSSAFIFWGVISTPVRLIHSKLLLWNRALDVKLKLGPLSFWYNISLDDNTLFSMMHSFVLFFALEERDLSSFH